MALLRVFTALISNALGYARHAVISSVSVRGGDACIEVSDDGTEFAPGTQARVFERFSSSRPAAGNSGTPRHYGLGLALVAEIVALRGGKIMAESAADGYYFSSPAASQV